MAYVMTEDDALPDGIGAVPTEQIINDPAASDLLDAANNRCIEEIAKGKKYSVQELLNAKNISGQSVFHLAAEKGCLDQIGVVLKKGEQVTLDQMFRENKDIVGASVMHVAAANGSLNQLDALLPEGVRPKKEDILTVQDNAQNTLFHTAGINGHLDQLKDFLGDQVSLTKEDLLSIKNGGDNTILHAAAHGEQLDILAAFVPTSERPNYEEIKATQKKNGEAVLDRVLKLSEGNAMGLIAFIPTKERAPVLRKLLKASFKDKFYDPDGKSLSMLQKKDGITLQLLSEYEGKAPDFWATSKNKTMLNKVRTGLRSSASSSISPFANRARNR